MSATPFDNAASCSVDALERVVHFTGAGADACFYASTSTPHHAISASSSTVFSPETLRYWLNPSVRARPTIATCEITNLGSPFFSPASTAQLRVAAVPLFPDGRCFPRRCVLSLATSAQRLDGLSVRPVVLQEWDLHVVHTDDATSSLLHSVSVAAQPCTTTIPVRTLYHVASLLSNGAASSAASPSPSSSAVEAAREDMENVRFYLQVRFTGCTDASDTHRIAAVQLTYEGLGAAATVLPLLQQRQRRLRTPLSGLPAAAARNVGGLDSSTFVEEIEVTITSDASSDAADVEAQDRADGPVQSSAAAAATRGVHTPTQRPERSLVIPAEEAYDSPPHRSATKPRAEKSSSTDRDVASLHQHSHLVCSSSEGTTRGDERRGEESRRHSSSKSSSKSSSGGTEVVRVERALRLPPPPPPPVPPVHSALSSSAAAAREDGTVALQGIRDASQDAPAASRDVVPWPGRATRTIVLAPSISPSLTSTSASGSPLSSPGSGGDSTPRSCAAASPSSVSSSSPVQCTPPPVATIPSATRSSEVDVPPRQRSGTVEVARNQDANLSHESDTPTAGLSAKSRFLSAASTASPPPRQIEAEEEAEGNAAVPGSDQTAQELFPNRSSRREAPPPVHRVEPRPREATHARSSAAVLWAATSLLGTAPWKQQSLQSSLRGSRAASAHSSRASSRERSGDAAQENLKSARSATASTAEPAEQPPASISFLPASKSRLLDHRSVDFNSTRPPPAQASQTAFVPAASSVQLETTTTPSPGFMSWRHTAERSALASSATHTDPTTTSSSSFWQWRNTSAFNAEASTRASPQLHPPQTLARPSQNTTSNTANGNSTAPAVDASFVTPQARAPSAYVPRLSFRTAAPSSTRTTQPSTNTSSDLIHQAPLPTSGLAVPPPPSQNKNLWVTKADRATPAVPSSVRQHVVADYAQPSWLPPRSTSTSSGKPASRGAVTEHAEEKSRRDRNAAPAKATPHETISVIPASWLQSQKTQSNSWKPPVEKGATAKTEKRAAELKSSDPTSRLSKRAAATEASARANPSSASLLSVRHPTPPPYPPPPRSRVLFHTTATTASLPSSRSTSTATSSAAVADAAPQPPSQEQQRERRTTSSADARLPSPPLVLATQRHDSEAPALPLQDSDHAPTRYAAQHRRRSRSAPEPRPPRHSSSSSAAGASSSSPSPSPPPPPALVLHRTANSHVKNTSSGSQDASAVASSVEARVFAVLKHHASRSGVGRRRLTIRPVAASQSRFNATLAGRGVASPTAGARCFLALEKVHGAAQLRDAVGFGVKGAAGSAGSTCEVPILQGDTVEVWTGLQAYGSGVIHKSKVHHPECCVVIRCNRQLVTAVEMESAEVVDTVSRLLLQ